METKKTLKSFSPEVRERAVRMMREHRGEYGSKWEAILSIASKIGCTGESLRRWVRQAERDAGERAELTTDERVRLKALEREHRELRQTNEIFAQSVGLFCGGGARPPIETMIAFIDDHRAARGRAEELSGNLVCAVIESRGGSRWRSRKTY